MAHAAIFAACTSPCEFSTWPMLPRSPATSPAPKIMKTARPFGIDPLRWSDVVDVMKRVARADPVEDEERDRQQDHDEEHFPAQRLAQAVAGDRPDSGHEVWPPTAST